MSDIKDNLEGCEICLRHVDVDTLVSMLDRKKFNIVAGGIADGDCGRVVGFHAKGENGASYTDRKSVV